MSTPSDESVDDVFHIDDRVADRPWFRIGDAVSWLFPLLGLVAFECFSNPGFSIVIASLKFGYSDLRTGDWLNRDPHVSRGRVLSLCYFARGLYAASASAFLILCTLVAWNRIENQNAPLNPSEALIGGVIWSVGLIIGTGCGGTALHYAARDGIRIWMDPTIHQARRERRWRGVCSGRTNQFYRLSFSVLAVGILLLGVVAMAASNSIRMRDWTAFPAVALIFGLPGCWCLSGVRKSWRLSASRPDECWGDPNRPV
jgi:hypothetical protein